MDKSGKTIRFGWAMILAAVVYRLFTAGVMDDLLCWLGRPENALFYLYTQTGVDARSLAAEEISSDPLPAAAPGYVPDYPAESPPPEIRLRFTGEEVRLTYFCDLQPDIPALLQAPLPWSAVPEVLILHTHTTESYTKEPGEDYQESSPYRTENPEYNMLHIGEITAEALCTRGIAVYHAETVHDSPQYNGAYTRARKTIRTGLKEHPDIGIVLDIHRDAVETADGQLCALAPGGEAQIMLVMGSSASGLKNPAWEQNLSLALKLQVVLERLSPGITRPIQLRAQRFNQDLSPGALLVEIGAAGNTRAQAESAAKILGQALSLLIKDSTTAEHGFPSGSVSAP